MMVRLQQTNRAADDSCFCCHDMCVSTAAAAARRRITRQPTTCIPFTSSSSSSSSCYCCCCTTICMTAPSKTAKTDGRSRFLFSSQSVSQTAAISSSGGEATTTMGCGLSKGEGVDLQSPPRTVTVQPTSSHTIQTDDQSQPPIVRLPSVPKQQEQPDQPDHQSQVEPRRVRRRGSGGDNAGDDAQTVATASTGADAGASTSAASAAAATAAPSFGWAPVEAVPSSSSSSSSALLVAHQSNVQLMAQMQALTQTNLQLLDRLRDADERARVAEQAQRGLAQQLHQLQADKTAADAAASSSSTRPAVAESSDPALLRRLEDELARLTAVRQTEQSDAQAVTLALRAELEALRAELKASRRAESELAAHINSSQSSLFALQQSAAESAATESSLRAQLAAATAAAQRSARETELSIGFATELRAHATELESRHAAQLAQLRLDQQDVQQQLLNAQQQLHAERIALAAEKEASASKDALIGSLRQQLAALLQGAQSASHFATANPVGAADAAVPVPSVGVGPQHDSDITAAFIAAETAAAAAAVVSASGVPPRAQRAPSKRSSRSAAVVASTAPAAATPAAASASASAPVSAAQPAVPVAPPAPSVADDLDGHAEFDAWMAQKDGARGTASADDASTGLAGRAAPPTFTPSASAPVSAPVADTLSAGDGSGSGSTALLSTTQQARDVADPLRRRDVFPTAEAEAEFHEWLRARQAEEEQQRQAAAAAPSSNHPATTRAAATERPPTAASYSESREGEMEFAAWLAQQQQPAAEVPAVEDTKKQPPRKGGASWPNFSGFDSPPPATTTAAQEQRKGAWGSTALSKHALDTALAPGTAAAPSAALGRVPLPSPSNPRRVQSWADLTAEKENAAPSGATVTAIAPALSSFGSGSTSARMASTIAPSKFSSANRQASAAAGANGSATPKELPLLGPPLGPPPSVLSFLQVPPVLWLRADSFFDSSAGRAMVDRPGGGGEAARIIGWADSSPHENHLALCSTLNRSRLYESHRALAGRAMVEMPGHTALKLSRAVDLARGDWTLAVVARINGSFPFLLGGDNGCCMPAFSSGTAASCCPADGPAVVVSESRAGSGFGVALFERRNGRVRASLHGHDVTRSIGGGSGGAPQCTGSMRVQYLCQCVETSEQAGAAQFASPALVAEIVLCDRALDQTETASMHKYLRDKYQI